MGQAVDGQRDPTSQPTFVRKYLESCQSLIHSSLNLIDEVSEEKMKFGIELVKIDSRIVRGWRTAAIMA